MVLLSIASIFRKSLLLNVLLVTWRGTGADVLDICASVGATKFAKPRNANAVIATMLNVFIAVLSFAAVLPSHFTPIIVVL
jgi:hypothetical protein